MILLPENKPQKNSILDFDEEPFEAALPFEVV